MNVEIDLTLVAIFASALSAIFAGLTFRRAGDWRRSDVGKETEAKLSDHGRRLTVLETKMAEIPTKADIASIKAELDGVQDELKLARGGITRIEDFLLERSK